MRSDNDYVVTGAGDHESNARDANSILLKVHEALSALILKLRMSMGSISAFERDLVSSTTTQNCKFGVVYTAPIQIINITTIAIYMELPGILCPDGIR